MTVDQKTDTVYTTFGSPASDFYGSDRQGNNLFGNSVVALDINTGKMKWYFQAVHHDLWDMDLPPAPILLDLTVKGKKIPALAQTGKVGYMYILNRLTGEPVFGIDEKPVAQSRVPGEHTSPTQPIPVKPPQLSRHAFDLATELVTAADTNEAHAKACADLIEKSGPLYNAGPFTPWVYRAPGAPPVSSVIFPGCDRWNRLGWHVRRSSQQLRIREHVRLRQHRLDRKNAGQCTRPLRSAQRLWRSGSLEILDRKTDANGALMGSSSWPCQKPPWGHLTAVNANTGEFAWRIVFGVTDELPEGKKNTGRVNGGGSIATAGGLVFIGATNDKRFHAFDSKTGKLLWEVKLDYDAIATPITYPANTESSTLRLPPRAAWGSPIRTRPTTSRSTFSRCRNVPAPPVRAGDDYFCLDFAGGGTTLTSYSV